jgi:hypothetical protein
MVPVPVGTELMMIAKVAVSRRVVMMMMRREWVYVRNGSPEGRVGAVNRPRHRTKTAGMSDRPSGVQLRRHDQRAGERRGTYGRACSTQHRSTPRKTGRIQRDFSAAARALASADA